MQLVLTADECEQIYYGQKRAPVSLTCPLCNQNGFSSELFMSHLNQQHPTITGTVLCPICFVRQSHLAEHLHRHREDTSTVIKTAALMLRQSSEGSLLNQLVMLPRTEHDDKERNTFIHGLLTHLLGQASL